MTRTVLSKGKGGIPKLCSKCNHPKSHHHFSDSSRSLEKAGKCTDYNCDCKKYESET